MFILCFYHELLDHIVEQMNLYAEQTLKRMGAIDTWRACIGILILIIISRMRQLQVCWCSDIKLIAPRGDCLKQDTCVPLDQCDQSGKWHIQVTCSYKYHFQLLDLFFCHEEVNSSSLRMFKTL